MSKIKVAIIGGSGLDDPQIFQNRREKFVDTPYGKPSDALVLGQIGDVECVLLSRHGRSHSVVPTNINFRANIHALKAEGCTHVLATTACGSLREHIHPGDLVILDQFIDRTTKRHQSFYDGSPNSPVGISHIPMHTPFCQRLRVILMEACQHQGYKYLDHGTMMTIEGPRFSSRAESKMFRAWGADLINMTTVPEVILAKEAGLCYAAIAMTTDYDSWRDDSDEHVSVEGVLKVFKENTEKCIQLLLEVIPRVAQQDWTATIKEYQTLAKESVMLPTNLKE